MIIELSQIDNCVPVYNGREVPSSISMSVLLSKNQGKNMFQEMISYFGINTIDEWLKENGYELVGLNNLTRNNYHNRKDQI